MASHGMADSIRAFTKWFSSHGGMLHPDVSFEQGKLTSDSHHGGFRSPELLQGLSDIQLWRGRTFRRGRLSCRAHSV